VEGVVNLGWNGHIKRTKAKVGKELPGGSREGSICGNCSGSLANEKKLNGVD